MKCMYVLIVGESERVDCDNRGGNAKLKGLDGCLGFVWQITANACVAEGSAIVHSRDAWSIRRRQSIIYPVWHNFR